MARLLLNVPVEAPSTGIINISKYKEESRRTLSAVSGATGRSALVNNFTFTKLKDNATSYILVTGVMGGLGMDNYPHIGMCCTIDQIGYGSSSTPSQASGHPAGPAGGGVYYCGVNTGSNNERTTFIVHKSFKTFNLGVGNHRLDIGWNANTNVRPTTYLNPNGTSDNGRHHQTGSHILVYEIAR